jgi:hypothetical protein
MKTKDDSVECEFHPRLTALLFKLDRLYNYWDDENVITSGSEDSAYHSLASLHYAGQAADIRIWTGDEGRGSVPSREEQYETILLLRNTYCNSLGVPHNWFDIVLESDHIHIEYQPKRLTSKHG